MSDEDSNLFEQATKGVKRLRYDGLNTNQLIKDAQRRNLKHTKRRSKVGLSSHQAAPWASEHGQAQEKLPTQNWSGDRDTISSVEPNSDLLYYRPGIPLKRFKQLRNGQIPIEATLDLHGYTLDSASEQLSQFLAQVKQSGFRCVRIVHGKGGRRGPNAPKSDFQTANRSNRPVLKSAINHWLPQDPHVLAFCSAPNNQGGRGAVLLLLKSRRSMPI